MFDHSHPTSRRLVRCGFLLAATLTLSLTAHSSDAIPLPLSAPGTVPALPTTEPNNNLQWESNYPLLALCLIVIVNFIYLVRWVTDWCCNCPTDLLRSSTIPDNHVLPLSVPHLTRAEDAGGVVSSYVDVTLSSVNRRVTLSSSTSSGEPHA